MKIGQEFESRVHQPGRWIAILLGSCFLLIGTIGFFTIGGIAPQGMPVSIPRLCAGLFAALGAAALVAAIRLTPVHVRHAASDVLPEVPREPLLREGSVVHGRLTHELAKNADGWEFRPVQSLWLSDRRLLLGFGIPCMALFSGLLSWVLHDRLALAGWPLSILCGSSVTLLCGGSVLLLMGMLRRAGCRRLCRLSIPCNFGDLELDSAEESDLDRMDLIEGMKWAFQQEPERRRLRMPRELVIAVQLCPWKYVVAGPESEATWAVQGLLVLSSTSATGCYRLPLLLTSDFAGAARLMQELANALDVPYLYSADADGWKVEEARAKAREPQKVGGIQG